MKTQSYTLKHKDVTFRYINREETSDKIRSIKYPTLILVYSGELRIKEDGCEISAGIGELVFIQADTTAILKEQCMEDKAFRAIYWDFGNTNPDMYPCYTGRAVKLTSTVYLRSLYVSLIPYIRMNVKLPADLLNIKSQEAVHCLWSAGMNKEFN